MNTTIYFKYQGKYISTPNLEKKLKRMGITKDDIEILEPNIKKEKIILEDNSYEILFIESFLDNRKFKTIVPIGYRPNIIDKYKENPLWFWNDNGQYIKETLSDEYLKTLCYKN